MRQYYIEGLMGIGDNIMQRPFIKTLCMSGNKVWLKTATPEFYADIANIHFVKSGTKLRTQSKNELSTNIHYEDPPTSPTVIKRIFYGNAELRCDSGIFGSFKNAFGCNPSSFDMPEFDMPDIEIHKGSKIAIIRPTTERREWHNAARGPLNAYINEASILLSEAGYYCISVADIEEGKEWIPDMVPFAHQHLHHGELSIPQLMGLVRHSDVVVTGPGLISQASFAYHKPVIFIGGGCGGSNHHSKITDPEIMDLSTCLFIYPDNYCTCQLMKHDCNKRISGLKGKINGWLNAKYQ